MAVLGKVKKGFLDSVTECRELFAYSLRQPGQGSEAGIEGAFLQMFKSWEYFLEESVIAYLCGRLSCDGGSVVCHIVTPSEDVARNILYQEKSFVEWTDIDKVRYRLRLYFPHPNRIESALTPWIVDLKHITRVRNAIAHTSVPARKNFQNLVQGLFGGKPRLMRPAALLSAPYPEIRGKTFFDKYADVLEFTSTSITG